MVRLGRKQGHVAERYGKRMRPAEAKTREAVETVAAYANVAFDHLAKLGGDPAKLVLAKLNEMASKRGQSQATVAAAKDLIMRALKRQDKTLQRRSAEMSRKTLRAMNRVFPEVDRQLIGDIVADLNSLWDAGQKLDKDLKGLFRMRFPQDRLRRNEFLSGIEANQIEMSNYWIRRLRRNMTKLRLALNREEQE